MEVCLKLCHNSVNWKSYTICNDQLHSKQQSGESKSTKYAAFNFIKHLKADLDKSGYSVPRVTFIHFSQLFCTLAYCLISDSFHE